MTYVGKSAGNRSVGKPWKGWINTVKNYLRKKGLDVKQASGMVHGRSS